MRGSGLILVLCAGAALMLGCSDRRAGGGYRGVPARDAAEGGEHPDATGEGGRDASSGEPDSGGETHWDGGALRDAGMEGWPDAQTWPDAQSWPDAFFPDATAPDALVFADAAPRDAFVPPLPDGGAFDGGRPDSGLQTTISLQPGISLVTVDLTVAAGVDPIRFSTTLDYDNGGPGNQTFTISSVSVSFVIFGMQTFQVAPAAHVASVGHTTQSVTKVAGSQDNIPSLPSLFCQVPACIVTIDFSNGTQLSDIVTPTCIQ